MPGLGKCTSLTWPGTPLCCKYASTARTSHHCHGGHHDTHQSRPAPSTKKKASNYKRAPQPRVHATPHPPGPHIATAECTAIANALTSTSCTDHEGGAWRVTLNVPLPSLKPVPRFGTRPTMGSLSRRSVHCKLLHPCCFQSGWSTCWCRRSGRTGIPKSAARCPQAASSATADAAVSPQPRMQQCLLAAKAKAWE